MSSFSDAEIKASRDDEIEALSAIYGNDWKNENLNGNVFSIVVRGEDPERWVNLKITLSSGYPLLEPPAYEISAPWLKRDAKSLLCNSLESIYCDHVGESVIFIWIENIKEFLNANQDQNEFEPKNSDSSEEIRDDHLNSEPECESSASGTTPIFHGRPISDRKSTFQAHVAVVVSVNQVKEVSGRLLENRKIASAAHNIMAYRIYIDSTKTYLQDCDDDGETHAGSRLSHLLQILDAKNVVVVVSRWYGGIQLGPDRFKHINNVARDILKEHGLIPDQKDDSTKGKKKKGK